MNKSVLITLRVLILSTILLAYLPAQPYAQDASKIGITQSSDIALIKMNFTSKVGAPAQGTAELMNIGKSSKSAYFEITILQKDNKTPAFKLSSKVVKIEPGKRAFVDLKAVKETLPMDRKFIFSFRTFEQVKK